MIFFLVLWCSVVQVRVDDVSDADAWAFHERFISRFRDRQPFAFVRYNDGEWFAVRHWLKKINPLERERILAGRLGQSMYAERGDYLTGAWPCESPLGIPEYQQCTENISRSLFRALVSRSPVSNDTYYFQSGLYWDGWREDYSQWGLRLKFRREDVIHDLVRGNVAGLEAWATYLRRPHGHTVLVGPCSYRALMNPLGVSRFLEIPRLHSNAREVTHTLNRVEHELRHYLANISGEARVICVLLSCGILTNVIIERLFDWSLGRFFLIDIGSAFDALLDHPSIALFRRMPGGNPATIRRAIAKPSQETMDRFRHLLPQFNETSDPTLIDILTKTWLGEAGQGLDSGNSNVRRSCEFEWTSNLYSVAQMGDPRAIRAIAWCYKRGYIVGHAESEDKPRGVTPKPSVAKWPRRASTQLHPNFEMVYAEPASSAIAHWRLGSLASEVGEEKEAKKQRLLAEQRLRLLGILEV